jgi:outer membrane protein assembly factor BamB
VRLGVRFYSHMLPFSKNYHKTALLLAVWGLVFCQHLRAGETPFSFSRPLVVAWNFESKTLTGLAPVEIGGVLITPLTAGVVLAVAADDGELLWKAELGGELSCSPAADLNAVFVASEETPAAGGPAGSQGPRGVLRALSRANGITLWSKSLPTPLRSLLLHRGTIYGVGDGGRFYALRSEGGGVLWETKLPSTPQGGFAHSNGKIFIATKDGGLIAVDGATGRTLWDYRTQKAMAGLFAVDGDRVYLGTAGGYVHALEEVNGQLRLSWSRRAGTAVQGVSLAPGGLLVTSLDNFAYFLEPRRGRRVWKRQLPGRVLPQVITDARNALLTPLGGEACIALSLKDGRLVNTLPVGKDNGIVAPPLLTDSNVIVPTRNGLLAFAPPEQSRR